jgi:hypothetical protein
VTNRAAVGGAALKAATVGQEAVRASQAGVERHAIAGKHQTHATSRIPIAMVTSACVKMASMRQA